MVGSAFARAEEAPGQGNHWSMATPHANLHRGTRIKAGISASLKQILFGPASVAEDQPMEKTMHTRQCYSLIPAA